jgi:hypothetical protein
MTINGLELWIYANGKITGDGSGLTGITASGIDEDCRQSTGALRVDLNQVKIDTGTLSAEIKAVALSTGAIRYDLDNLKIEVENLTADVDELYFSTGNFIDTTATRQTKEGGLNVLGSVGIGTTSPEVKLGVQAQSHNEWLIETLQTDGQKGVQIGMWDSDNSAMRLSDSVEDEKILLRTRGSSYFLNDKIGIGTAEPSAKLDVAGNVVVGGEARIRDFIYAGKGRFANNELMLYPDSLNRVYIYGKEPGDSWTDIFFWMPPKEGWPGGRSQYVYARGFRTYTSTRTVVTADTSELLDIIAQEVNKPLFDPAAEEGPPSLGSSKDVSEVAMASGILSLRFYIEINALKAEIERLRDRIVELEKR